MQLLVAVVVIVGVLWPDGPPTHPGRGTPAAGARDRACGAGRRGWPSVRPSAGTDCRAGHPHRCVRTAGTLAGRRHATARAATIRRHLVAVAGRIACHARVVTIHLPEHWPWQHEWQRLFTAANAPARLTVHTRHTGGRCGQPHPEPGEHLRAHRRPGRPTQHTRTQPRRSQAPERSGRNRVGGSGLRRW